MSSRNCCRTGFGQILAVNKHTHLNTHTHTNTRICDEAELGLSGSIRLYILSLRCSLDLKSTFFSRQTNNCSAKRDCIDLTCSRVVSLYFVIPPVQLRDLLHFDEGAQFSGSATGRRLWSKTWGIGDRLRLSAPEVGPRCETGRKDGGRFGCDRAAELEVASEDWSDHRKVRVTRDEGGQVLIIGFGPPEGQCMR